MKKLKPFCGLPFLLLLPLFIISCSASTASRYGKTEKPKETSITSADTANVDNNKEAVFDMTNYRAEISVKEGTGGSSSDNEMWYEYPSVDSSDNLTRTPTGKAEGYRVQVISTDNLDEANIVRSETHFKANVENVYIIFDPPFYKVRAGDFLTQQDAGQLKFRLNQMGYGECRVVKDSVNIF